MKMKAFLMFVLLFLCSMGTKAQDLGANYNENIDYPITEIEMLKQSKVCLLYTSPSPRDTR